MHCNTWFFYCIISPKFAMHRRTNRTRRLHISSADDSSLHLRDLRRPPEPAACSDASGRLLLLLPLRRPWLINESATEWYICLIRCVSPRPATLHCPGFPPLPAGNLTDQKCQWIVCTQALSLHHRVLVACTVATHRTRLWWTCLTLLHIRWTRADRSHQPTELFLRVCMCMHSSGPRMWYGSVRCYDRSVPVMRWDRSSMHVQFPSIIPQVVVYCTTVDGERKFSDVQLRTNTQIVCSCMLLPTLYTCLIFAQYACMCRTMTTILQLLPSLGIVIQISCVKTSTACTLN